MEKNNKDLDNIEFVFYGDLLGMSNFYNISQELADKKRNEFYNLMYNKFINLVNNKEIKIFLFSDSILISGNKLKTVIQLLGEVYYDLFYDNIFLRGAIAKGTLNDNPCIELENFKNRLISTHVLFKLVSLEKSVKGIRLLLEKELAQYILPPEWVTDDLYRTNIALPSYDKYDFRRKIVLASEWHAYEYLWPCRLNFSEMFSGGIGEYIHRLLTSPYKLIEERLLQVPKVVRIHLEETKEVLVRSGYRYEITDKALDLYQKNVKQKSFDEAISDQQ